MKHRKAKPPKWADKLLQWYCSESFLEEIQGDLHEWFYKRVERQGAAKARLFYFLDVIRFFRTFRLKSYHELSPNSNNMLGHHIKLAIRNFSRDKFSFILKTGNLAVGIAVCLMVLVYVDFERNYDKKLPNSNNIYRLEHIFQGNRWAATPVGIGPYALDNVPEVKSMVRFLKVNDTWFKYKDKIFTEENGYYTDTTVLDHFNFEFIKGNPETALDLVNSIVLTESLALKYFGKEDPIGALIELEMDGGNTRMVTGVIKDIPFQTHLKFDFLVPNHVMSDERLRRFSNWGTYTYVKLEDGADLITVSKPIASAYHKFYKMEEDMLQVAFIPFADIHLYSNSEKEITANSNIQYLYILSIAALFVLAISIINFTNLNIIRGLGRSKEVGIKKAIGAFRNQLINQSLVETLLSIVIGAGMGILLFYLALPFFRDFSGLPITYSPELLAQILLAIFVLILIISLLGGLYPALLFASFKPSEIIKTGNSTSNSGFGIIMLRKTMIVLQFVISTVLIIGSVVIYSQLDHISNKKLGFEKDQVILIPMGREMRSSMEAIKQELLGYGGIVQVASSSHVPGYRIMVEGLVDVASKEELLVRMMHASPEFLETYGIKIVEGRDFTRSQLDDDQGEWIINRTAQKLMYEDKNPIGQIAAWGNENGPVVGVMEDFHYQSLHAEIMPLAIYRNPGWVTYASVKFKAQSVDNAINAIKTTGKKLFPNLPPIEYEFLEKRFGTLYQSEMRLKSLVWIFCGISILLTISGIIALSTYMAKERTKEFAIRKVLGSSTINIINLMGRGVVILALISLVISIPASYYLINWWLQNFAYPASIGFGIYVLSATMLIVIILTSAAQITLKTAYTSPVKSLRSE